MPRFRLTIAALTLSALTLLTACATEPELDPTPTGFATEEEAFEAARETYEAYIEALNAADPAQPETIEPMYEWLEDDALAAARVEFTGMTAEGWSKSGDAVVTLISPHSFSDSDPIVAADVCLDVSNVEAVDENDTSVVHEDRSDTQPMQIRFNVSPTTSTNLKISLINGREAGPTCE